MKTKWTIENLQEEVNKYKTRTEFGRNNRNAYLTALNNKMMEELFKNHINNGYNENRKINTHIVLHILKNYLMNYSKIFSIKITNCIYQHPLNNHIHIL